MRVTLEVIKGHIIDRGKRLKIIRTEPDNITFGRSVHQSKKYKDGDAHLQVSSHDLRVSRWHFMLMIRPPNCYIRDLGSANHTFVNNFEKKKYIKDVVELKNENLIKVGRTHLKVHIVYEKPKESHEPLPIKSIGELREFKKKYQEQIHQEHLPPIKSEINEKEKHIWVIEEEPKKKIKLFFKSNRGKKRKQQLEEKPIELEKELVVQCFQCGKDMSSQANSDGKANTLKDAAIYLCNECIKTQREEGKKIAEYTLLNQIGSGGMGVVYKAVHKPTGRLVALKEIITDKPMDKKGLELFCREISITSDIIHPSIVRFYDSFIRERKPYLVTEYLPGGNADERLLNQQKPFYVEEAYRIIIEILEGLAYIHEKGIVHRDVKPQNILFDKNGRAKLSDMGLAKSYELAGQSGITGADEISGTILYMAPEQILDFCFVKPPADVYSIGVCFYYFLTGKFPYHFPSSLDMLMQPSDLKEAKPLFNIILEKNPIPIIERKQDIPEGLAGLIDKCLRKKPIERFKDGKELMEALMMV